MDISLGSEKDVSLFEKVQIIGMHQAEETEKNVETDKIKLKIVHCLLGNIVSNRPKMFNGESKSNSTRTTWKEFETLELKLHSHMKTSCWGA